MSGSVHTWPFCSASVNDVTQFIIHLDGRKSQITSFRCIRYLGKFADFPRKPLWPAFRGWISGNAHFSKDDNAAFDLTSRTVLALFGDEGSLNNYVLRVYTSDGTPRNLPSEVWNLPRGSACATDVRNWLMNHLAQFAPKRRSI